MIETLTHILAQQARQGGINCMAASYRCESQMEEKPWYHLGPSLYSAHPTLNDAPMGTGVASHWSMRWAW